MKYKTAPFYYPPYTSPGHTLGHTSGQQPRHPSYYYLGQQLGQKLGHPSYTSPGQQPGHTSGQQPRQKMISRLSQAPLLRFILGALFFFVLHSAPAQAQIPLVRDEEIEKILREWSLPIFEAANLNPEQVRIYLVQSDELNAFVANGQNIFLNTGLLRQTKSPEQIIGVIAHESAHIAGGHLARFDKIKENAAYQQILSTLIGAGAIIGGAAQGNGQVATQSAQAILLGGQTIAQRRLLADMRLFEASADKGALKYLDDSKVSSQGLLEFLRILNRRSKLYAGRIDPYLLSHPLDTKRISHIQLHLEDSPHRESSLPKKWHEQFARMQAKLSGFLISPERTLAQYRDDSSIAGRYAQAIALYRAHRLDLALAEMRGLIAQEKDNPYFHELLGQILFESSRINQSLPSLEKAHELIPGSALMRISLARAQLESGNAAILDEAIDHLQQATRIEPDNALAWHFLSLGYGKRGEVGSAALAIAENALLRGDLPRARNQAQRAEKLLPADSPLQRRARDILAIIP